MQRIGKFSTGLLPFNGRRTMGRRGICYRGPGGGGGRVNHWEKEWGTRPLAAEITVAREFQAQGLRGKKASNAFLSEIISKREISLKALLWLDPVLTTEIMGWVAGRHSVIGELLEDLPTALVVHLVDQLILPEFDADQDRDKLFAYTTSLNMYLAFVRIEQKQLREIYMRDKEARAQFINQYVYFIMKMDNPDAIGPAKAYLDFYLLKFRDGAAEAQGNVYEELTKEARNYIERSKGSAFFELLKTKAEKTVKWREELGPEPTGEEVAAARAFIERKADWEEFLDLNNARGFGIDAVFYLDPQYAARLIGLVNGRHDNMGAYIGTFPRALIMELFDCLILEDSSDSYDDELVPLYMYSLIKYLFSSLGSNAEAMIKGFIDLFNKTQKKSQLINQLVYGLEKQSVNFDMFFNVLKSYLLFLEIKLDKTSQIIGLWPQLTDKAKDFIIQQQREKLAQLLGNEVQVGKIDVSEFLTRATSCAREEDSGLSYSAQAVELFLETFAEEDRSGAMAALLKEDEDTARMLMRSAKGYHVEIAAALSGVPQELLLPALQREILAFPTLNLGDRQELSDFYTHNGFGVMKYLIYNGDPSQIRMSPLFSKLSNEAIAKLLQIFHVFCTMESMLGRMLAGPLGKSIDELGLARIAEISSGTLAETIAWLRTAKVIDVAQMLADYAELEDELGPNETLFSGKVYSTIAWEEFRQSGQNLADLDPRQRGIVLRSAKFHGETRALLESFSNQEIADILDAELSHFAGFADQAQTRRFMELDGCSLMKIVALLPVERAVSIINRVNLEAQAAIFEQARYFSQTSEYFLEEFIERLRSFDLDRDKVVDALSLLTQEAADWIRDRIFNEDLSEIEFERRMREALELGNIQELNDLTAAGQLATQLYADFITEFTDCDLIEEPEDLYRFVDQTLSARRIADIRGQNNLAESEALFMLCELARKVIELSQPVIARQGIDNIQGIKDGQVVAKVVVIDNKDWQENVASLYHLSPFNLVVISEHPANDPGKMSKVAGFVTGRNKGNYDHSTLLAKSWGIPLANLPAAPQLLKGLNGKWVVFNVEGDKASIALASADQIRAAQQEFSLISVEEVIKDRVDILNLPAEVRENVGRVGVKAFNLAELAEYTNVPPFHVLTVGAAHRYFKAIGLYDKAREILDSSGNLARIREIIMQGQLPQDYLQGLAAEHIIARASTNLEDLEEFTAAGVYGSYVGTSEELETIIKKAMASYWSDKAFAYREKYGVDHFEQLPAVIIQSFVPGDFSGNMIVDGGQAIVNIVPGLGEGHASGRVPADEYHYSFVKGEFTRIEKRPRGEAARISGYESVTGQEQLTDGLIIKLALIGQLIHNKKGKRQDVEWTIKDGMIYIVQTRPV